MNMLRDMLQPTRRNMLRGMFTSTSALTRFGINGVEAALALDFIGGEYRTANTSTTFADAFTGTSPKLTYSTAAGSNSTMTQGYGPELVENGHFTSNTSGWSDDSSAGGSLSWNDGGHLDLTHSGGVVRATQNIAVTQGKTYAIEFRLVAAPSSSGLYVAGSNVANFVTLGVGTHTVYYTATATGSVALQARVFAAGTVTIDNISVREAPKIVWAPHNLIRYSEDLSGSYWASTNLVDPVQQSDTVLSPDGSAYAYYIQEDTAATAHQIRDTFGPLVNATWTASIYIKQKDAGMYVQLRPYGVGTGLAYATFSAADGTLYESGGTELVSAADGVAVGDGWFKVSMTCSTSLPASNDGLNIVLSDGTAGENPAYTSSSGNGVYIWGAHVYRSDLGGMAQVPGAATGFEYYVPTNGNAEYLPRVGHHVYNGSTWVNEGLLIESEARTNLIQYSEDFSHSSWALTFIEPFGSGSTVNATTGPDGQTTADFIRPTTDSTNQHYVRANVTSSVGASYTISVYAKAGGYSSLSLRALGTNAPVVKYDLATGTADDPAGTIQAVGNGWFRCSLTGEATATYLWHYIYPNQNSTYAGDGTSGIYVWGAQIDQGQVVNGTPVDAPTPSSYMPTYGNQFTRTAQSLEVPPAEFGWPEPEYIGPELVTNGGFDADTSGWSNAKAGIASVDGELKVTNQTTSPANTTQLITGLTVGSVYKVSGTYWQEGSGTNAARLSFFGKTTPNNGTSVPTTYEMYVVATATSATLSLASFGTSATESYFDNISVREINPLSVSIQMDGRMTYADDGASQSAVFYNWAGAGANIIRADLATNGAYTGGVVFMQYTPSFNNSPEAVPGSYSPGVNVPYNISSRHGSTFIRGAADGVLANLGATTPTALPDLSSANLQIAQDFMGTIGQFRQFAGDIGDTGLVTATNPSTEPTLSLTFDGTDGSFYNLSWSE